MVEVTPPVGRTDFARYPHADLIRMLAESDPHGVTAVGDVWAAVGRSLHERADDLDRQLADFTQMWTGGAADRYRTMIVDLASGVRRVADAVLEFRDLTYTGGEALQAAWLTMPAVADEAAHRQAVLVMAALAERYEAIHRAIPTVLAAVPPPAPGGRPPGPGGSGPGGYPGAGSGTPGAAPPLFGSVLPAGIAAASAALGRQFVPSRPPDPEPDPEPDPTPAPGDPGAGPTVPEPPPPGTVPPPGGAPGLGGAPPPALDLGAPGGGGGASLALAGGAGAAGYSALTATGGTGPGAPPGFAGPVAGADTGRTAGIGMVPPMPMGMMGGAEAGGGGGRRIPSWLVETEDIWGESAVVTPSVIGEEQA